MAGILYLVATPIGNLGDLSPRAVETLRMADFIAAEDTRVSLRLLNHFDIRKPLVSYHEHNRAAAGPAIVERLLPGIDGFEVCRRIRATNPRIGIIMLTARSQEVDKVTGLMNGADDYVTKPFSPVELTARVDALIRRSSGGTQELPPGTISQPPFLLNTRNRTLEKNGQRIKLTQVEYSIMRMFMENPGKALSREEILDLVWGRDYFGELKIVDVNVRRLRLKIEDSPTSPTYINTVWGYGYKWGF